MRNFKLSDWKSENIYTKDGRHVRVLCTDRKHKHHGGSLVALVEGPDKQYEQIVQYNAEGQQVNYDLSYPHAVNYDLVVNDD